MTKMENICRLCLRKKKKMSSIFSFDNKNLHSQIINCCSIEISENDILPKLICIKCIKKVETFHEFKKECKKSDCVLREHYKMEFNVELNLNDLKVYQDVYVQTDMTNTTLQMENSPFLMEVNKVKEESDFNTYLDTNDNDNQDDNVINSSKYLDHVVSNNSDSRNSFEIEELKIEYDCKENIEEIETGVRKSKRLKNKHTFKCNSCLTRYKSKEELLKHIQSHVDEEILKKKPRGKFQCDICKVLFNKQLKLDMHMQTHGIESTKTQYICDLCNNSFITKSGLLRHMKIHSGSRPYACQYCNKTFIILSYKKRHERTHKTSKDFVCHICSARYSSLNGFKYHLQVHTGEANYPCRICGKYFRRRRFLNEHTFTHTGEKPYVCKICGSGFANSGTLFAHEKKCKSKDSRNNTVSARKAKRK